MSDYQPFISSSDRYLADWKSRLLSYGSRVVLVNAILGSLPIHYMLSMLLLRTDRETIDGKRLAFLWTGLEKCNQGQRLIAWDRVCLSKHASGLGVRNIEDQNHCLLVSKKNHCLLMKFVHKLLSPNVTLGNPGFFVTLGPI